MLSMRARGRGRMTAASAFLTADDVERLTRRIRYSAQRRVLDAMGIRYLKAANGEPLVRADALDADARPARNSGPRWERIGAKPAA